MPPSTNTALLILDMQAGILTNYPAAEALMTSAELAIRAARQKGIPVIFSAIGFRPGAPEMSVHNKLFNNQERFANLNMEGFMAVPSQLRSEPDDLTLIKRRVSAFSGSDLDILLSAAGIRHLVLAGITTSGVVLSTVREAADKDYRLTVLADACADVDDQVHHVLMTKVFPRQAEVIHVADWASRE